MAPQSHEDGVSGPLATLVSLGLGVANRREGGEMLPPEEELLSDKQLREATNEQLWNLIAHIDLLQGRGDPGIAARSTEDAPEDQPHASDPADPGEA